MKTIRDFMSDEVQELSYYEEPKKIELSDIAPSFDKWLKDCEVWGIKVPEGLTAEIYVKVWNEIVEMRSNNN